jgi:hypothetical protein
VRAAALRVRQRERAPIAARIDRFDAVDRAKREKVQQ